MEFEIDMKKLTPKKIAYFVADTVVAGVTKTLVEKALHKVAPGLDDHEIVTKLISGGTCMVVTAVLDAPVHKVVDHALGKINPDLLLQEEPETEDTPTTTE